MKRHRVKPFEPFVKREFLRPTGHASIEYSVVPDENVCEPSTARIAVSASTCSGPRATEIFYVYEPAAQQNALTFLDRMILGLTELREAVNALEFEVVEDEVENAVRARETLPDPSAANTPDPSVS